MNNAQYQVKNDLKVAQIFYENELNIFGKALELSPINNLSQLKRQLNLNYLYLIDASTAANSKDEIILKALNGSPVSGSRRVSYNELKTMGNNLAANAQITIINTPKARPTSLKTLNDALAIEYARPILDENGKVAKILYGGKLINKDFALVDQIRDSLFENKLYNNKPIGTVTIFLDDVRVTTNVLTKTSERAIGTRVSQKVYENVVEKGKTWVDRAFVVTDWYITSYQPIKNVDGKIIGILYVGLLEQPLIDLQKIVLLIYLIMVMVVAGIAVLIAIYLAKGIYQPIGGLINATTVMAQGDGKGTQCPRLII
jgi:two-component system NtrC family sensor kinase